MFIYFGLFFLSCATLLFEVSLTRLLSVSLWSHFAFLVVSIAMFGFGASGTFLSLAPKIGKKIYQWLSFFSFSFSVTSLAGFIAANRLSFDPFRITWDHTQVLYLAAFYLILSAPFFCTGICLAIAFTQKAKRAGFIYAADLTGAAIGAMLPIVLFPLFGPKIIIFAAWLAGLAAFCFTLKLTRKIKFLLYLWLFSLSFAIVKIPFDIKISPYKSLSVTSTFPGSQLLGTFWNAFSRIDVVKSSAIKYAPGLSLKYQGALPPQLGITIDANSLSAITSPDDLNFVKFLPSSLAYHLSDGKKVLIINPGGGLNVVTALYFQRKVTVVEENPIIVDLLQNKHQDFAGNIYEPKKVKIEIEKARSFIRKSREKYDIIQLPLMGTVVSASTGIYGLSENYLLTSEAFSDYYFHLNDGGLLTITYWLSFPPKETPRLVSLATAALENLRVTDQKDRLAVVRTGTTGTLLLKKGKFSQAEISKIKQFCRKNNFDLVFLPGIRKEEVNQLNKLPEPYYFQMVKDLLGPKRKKLLTNYLFDITPVSDNRPYFFNFFKWNKLVSLYKSLGKKWEPFFEGGFISLFALLQALILSILFIILPVFAKRLNKSRAGGLIFAYFACLGLGFMFVEVILLYKFILFLGHPVLSFSIVLSSLLFFSGLGSLLSQKFSTQKLRGILLALGFLILITLKLYPLIFTLALGQKLTIRALTTIGLLAPLSLFLGMPFPLGVRLTRNLDKKLIPWAFSINACFSVVGSILALTLAQFLGFNLIMILAAFFYLAGLGTVFPIFSESLPS